MEEVLRIAVPIGEDEADEAPPTRNYRPARIAPRPVSESSDEKGQVTARRIFVVDDEPVIADSLTAILNQSGYDATAFYDGESALAASKANVPECIISDVVMTGMSGLELAVRIREAFPDCQILLFSGQAATSHMLEATRRIGHDFEVLLKPVHPSDLLARLGMGQEPQGEAASSSQSTTV